MSVVHRLLPCGIYVTEYIREPGEYAALVRRSEERFTATATRAATPETTTLAMLIQQGLRHADMTITELADELGVQHSSAATWIKSTSPNNQNLKRLCVTLNLDYIEARRLSGRDPIARRAGMTPAREWNQGVGSR